MRRSLALCVALLGAAAGCSTETYDSDDTVTVDAAPGVDQPGDEPITRRCKTTISYGENWVLPPDPKPFDEVDDLVTWDGNCTNEGTHSFARLSNGFTPYFRGNDSCVIALDYSQACEQPIGCKTRVIYGPAWIHPMNHPAQYDDTTTKVTWDGSCVAAGSNSIATLSNGWRPYFAGANKCAFTFRYVQCGGI